MRQKLSTSMTVTEFDNGYWYATDLKAFADSVGFRATNALRKDELEKAIKRFLQTGTVASPTRRNLSPRGKRDVERGLRLSLPVVNYFNDSETKSFLEREARKLVPGFKKRSGARYRLNRWRERQLTAGRSLTYGRLVEQYVRLCQRTHPFTRIPHGRYINFMSEFLAGERIATRQLLHRYGRRLRKRPSPHARLGILVPRPANGHADPAPEQPARLSADGDLDQGHQRGRHRPWQRSRVIPDAGRGRSRHSHPARPVGLPLAGTPDQPGRGHPRTAATGLRVVRVALESRAGPVSPCIDRARGRRERG